MSLIQHEFFPRSMFDMNEWFRSPIPISSTSTLGVPIVPLTTMDLFDPFDELDTMISRNLQWLNKPSFLSDVPLIPRVPQKYRVTVDCAGFSPTSIKTELKEKNKLVVWGCEESKLDEKGDFSKKEFKKSYQLPANVEGDKMVSFMAGGNKLIVEIPLKESEKGQNVMLLPQTVDNKDGTKSVQMKFIIPNNVDPNKAHVSVKDRDLILRVEDKQDKPDLVSRLHYYQRTTLPENTDFDHLKCVVDNNVITATAPLDLDFRRTTRQIPIEHKKSIGNK